MGILYFLVIGVLAGFLGGKIMRGGGFGPLGNLIVGVLGAMLGGFLAGILGLAAVGLVGSLVTATAGAVVLLYLLGFVKK